MEETDEKVIVLRDWLTKVCGLSFRIADKLAEEFTDSGITEIDQFHELYRNNHDWLDHLECKLPRLTKDLINSVVEKIGRIPLQSLTVQDVAALLQTCYEGFDYYLKFQANLINGFNLKYVQDVETLMEFGIPHATHAGTLLASLNEWRRIGVPNHLVTLSDEEHSKRLLSIKSEQRSSVVLANSTGASSTEQLQSPAAIINTTSTQQNNNIPVMNTFLNHSSTVEHTIDKEVEEGDAGTACSVEDKEDDLESLDEPILVAPATTTSVATTTTKTDVAATTVVATTTTSTTASSATIATYNQPSAVGSSLNNPFPLDFAPLFQTPANPATPQLQHSLKQMLNSRHITTATDISLAPQKELQVVAEDDEEDLLLLLCSPQRHSARKRKMRRIIVDDEDEAFETEKHRRMGSTQCGTINTDIEESSSAVAGRVIPSTSSSSSGSTTAMRHDSNGSNKVSRFAKSRLPTHALLSGELLSRLASIPVPASSSLVLLADTAVNSTSSSNEGLASTQSGRQTPSPPSSLTIPKNSPGHWEYHSATSPEGRDQRQLVFVPQPSAAMVVESSTTSASARDTGNDSVGAQHSDRKTDPVRGGSLCLSEDDVGEDHFDFGEDLFEDSLEDSFSLGEEEHVADVNSDVNRTALAPNEDRHNNSSNSRGERVRSDAATRTRRSSYPAAASTDRDGSSAMQKKRGRPRSSDGARSDAPTPGSHSTRSTTATTTSATAAATTTASKHRKEGPVRYRGIQHACDKLLVTNQDDKTLMEAMYAINDGFKRNKARGFVDVIVDSGGFLRFLHFIHNAKTINQIVLYRVIFALCEIAKRTDAIAEVRTILQPTHFRALLKLLGSTNQFAREQALVLIGDIGIGANNGFKQAVLAAGAIKAIVKCFDTAVVDFAKSQEDIEHVQGRCITAIYSLVSLSTPEQFHYFEPAIPILIAMLKTNSTASDREHIADAIQSASFLITEYHPEHLDILINTKLFDCVVQCLLDTDSHDEVRWYACAFIWQFAKHCVPKQLRFLYRITATLMHIFQYNRSDVHLRAAALNTLQVMLQRDEYFIQQFVYHRDNILKLIVDYVKNYPHKELIHGPVSKAETIMKYASLTLIQAVLGANNDQQQRLLDYGVYPLLFKIISLQGEIDQPEEIKLKAVAALKKLLTTYPTDVFTAQIKAQKRDFQVTESWDIVRSLVSASIPPKNDSSHNSNNSNSSVEVCTAGRTSLWSAELRNQAREVLVLANTQGLLHTL